MPPQPNPFLSTVLNPSPPPPTNHPSTTHTPSHPSSSTSTPTRSPRPAQSSHHGAPSTFTAAQRSLQARNKPFASPSSAPQTSESHDSRAARAQAADILDSIEMLTWYAQARNESVAATRRYYRNVLFGLPDRGFDGRDRVVWREKWEVPSEERDGTPGAKGKRRGVGVEEGSASGSPRDKGRREKEKRKRG